MSNPYDCSVCHNEGYDHAPDCPFHPDNLKAAAEAGMSEEQVEALAEELWANSASPGAAPTDTHRDLARAVLASDWFAARLAEARAEEADAMDVLADTWFDEDAGIEHVAACQDYGCKDCVVIACAADIRDAARAARERAKMEETPDVGS